MEVLTLELRDRKGAVHRALVDQSDAHLLGSFTWRICPKGYVHRKTQDQFIYLHRVIAQPAPGLVVDHINGDKADNRRANLRLCTSAQNQQNAQIAKNNASGFKGVSRRGAQWIARITADKHVIYLGLFEDPRVAAHAYNRAAMQFHGEFARLNPL